jgi:hypothetical protein
MKESLQGAISTIRLLPGGMLPKARILNDMYNNTGGSESTRHDPCSDIQRPYQNPTLECWLTNVIPHQGITTHRQAVALEPVLKFINDRATAAALHPFCDPDNPTHAQCACPVRYASSL